MDEMLFNLEVMDKNKKMELCGMKINTDKDKTDRTDVCTACPRGCKVDRDATTGYCGVLGELMVARAALHMWEEPCISGKEGSGTIFFSGCNLRCVFCQNHNIAAGGAGFSVTTDKLAEIMLELQGKGANNINLVTPSHYVDKIVTSIVKAKALGLKLPIVYNTGGYDGIETLKKLDGLVDIYLPDFKYVSGELAKKYSNAPDYFEVASAALDEMYRQTGGCQFDDNGMMMKGIIVRHLILPGCVKDSKAVIQYIYEKYGDDVYISIMNQYTPLKYVEAYPEINRRVTKREYDSVVDYAIELGVENAFIQEGAAAKESFIPEFDGEGVVK